MNVLLLALGNDILGDDAVGLIAARTVKAQSGKMVDVVEANGGGLDLLDALEGYDSALLIDSVYTGKVPPGTIMEYSRQDFTRLTANSPHTVGLPEVLAMAEQMKIKIPERLRVLVMEVENSFEVKEGLSDSVASALPIYINRIREVVEEEIKMVSKEQ